MEWLFENRGPMFYTLIDWIDSLFDPVILTLYDWGEAMSFDGIVYGLYVGNGMCTLWDWAEWLAWFFDLGGIATFFNWFLTMMGFALVYGVFMWVKRTFTSS